MFEDRSKPKIDLESNEYGNLNQSDINSSNTRQNASFNGKSIHKKRSNLISKISIPLATSPSSRNIHNSFNQPLNSQRLPSKSKF